MPRIFNALTVSILASSLSPVSTLMSIHSQCPGTLPGEPDTECASALPEILPKHELTKTVNAPQLQRLMFNAPWN